MDAPPTNYNPNDSMLSGGTESIMKVMGGGGEGEGEGGGGVPDGYNETQSVLSGGIDSPIVKVVGGGGGVGGVKLNRLMRRKQQRVPTAPTAPRALIEPSAPSVATAPSAPTAAEEAAAEAAKDERSNIQIRYVTNYELDNDSKKFYQNNIKITYNNIKNDVKKFEIILEKNKIDTRKKIYHWKKKGKFIVTDTISDNLYGKKTEIKFIPNNIKQIIVLPPVNGNPETFFKQLTYLIDSKYVNDNLSIQSNIFIVSLKPFFKEGMLDEEIEDIDVITNFTSNIDINKLEEDSKLLDKLNIKGVSPDEKELIDKIISKQYDFWKKNNIDSFNNGIGDIIFNINNFNKDIKEYYEYLFNNKIKKNKNHINIFKIIKYCVDKITYILDEHLKQKPDDNNITNDTDHKTIIKLFNQIKRETNKSLGLQSGGEISQDSLLLRYYYSFLKKNNFDSYFIVNEPYTIVYPKKIGSKEGILFTTNDKKEFPKPSGNNELLPTDNEEIAENKVSYMVYNNSDDNYNNNEYYIISNGDIDVGINNKNPTFTLNKYIAILEVSSEDVPIVVVDMNGESYRIRLAKLNADSDAVYSEWIKGNYTKHEKQLLDDISLNKSKKDIADFLYYLGFYKCFNDVSLLTKNECMIVRDILKDLYKSNLTRKMDKMNLYKTNDLHYKNTNIHCVSAGVGSEGKISCEIYTNNRGITEKGIVEIDKPDIWNGSVTDEMKQEAFNKWKQQKK